MTRDNYQNRDFSFLTVAAVAASMLLVAVVLIGEHRKGAISNGTSESGLGVGVDREGRDGNAGQADTGVDAGPLLQTRPAVQAPAGPASGPVSRLPAGISDHTRGGTVPVVSADRRLFVAIRQVESGGNDMAIGDGGKSIGPYQCSLAAFVDGGGRACDYPRLAYDRAETETVMRRYWARYGAASDEQKARCWNSGSKWKSKYHLTNKYWNKVKAALEN